MRFHLFFLLIFFSLGNLFSQEDTLSSPTVIPTIIGCVIPALPPYDSIKVSREFILPSDSICWSPDIFPSFPGGKEVLESYLKENIIYPEIAKLLQLSGKSVLRFVVLRDGSIANIQIAKSMRDCKECDDEARRIARNMPCWIPGEKGGEKVNAPSVLIVPFVLPDSE